MKRTTTKAKERAKKIDRALRLVWWSMESHLHWTHHYSKTLDQRWEKKCVRDYAELIKILSELY